MYLLVKARKIFKCPDQKPRSISRIFYIFIGKILIFIEIIPKQKIIKNDFGFSKIFRTDPVVGLILTKNKC